MTQNLIASAFELVRDVEHGVLLLDTFHRLATREVRHPLLQGLPARVSLPPCPAADFSFVPSFRLPGFHISEECACRCVWVLGKVLLGQETKGTHLQGARPLVA